MRGHGAEVQTVAWHKSKGLIASGARDNIVKLWDPRGARLLQNLYSHKNTVTEVRWNANGNWLATAGRDSQIYIHDM